MTENKQPEWLKNVKVGDMIVPRLLWNKTTTWERNKLNSPTLVLAIAQKNECESGTLITVRTKGGERIALDSLWFTGVAT